jgi:hypothetical protein
MPAIKKEKVITLAFTVLICFFQLTYANAQVPGYMGKKFILSYCPSITPNVTEFTNSSDLPLKIYTKHVFQADYTIGRNMEIGLHAGFMRHKAAIEITPKNVVWWKFNGYNVGANLKMHLFNDNPVAPLGSFVKLNFQRLQYTLIDEYGVYEEDTSMPKRVEYTYGGYGVGIGVGVRRIFNDKITLEAGFDGNIVLIPDTNSNNDDYNSDASYFIFSKNFLTYNVGVGVLLF